MSLDNTKTITSVTYNGNNWPVGGGATNCKIWTYTNSSDRTSPFAVVSADADVAAHYNDTNAMCAVLYPSTLTTYQSYGSGFATNVSSGNDSESYPTYGVSYRKGSSAVSAFPQRTPLSDTTQGSYFITANSSGNITLNSASDIIRPAGTYIIVFSW